MCTVEWVAHTGRRHRLGTGCRAPGHSPGVEAGAVGSPGVAGEGDAAGASGVAEAAPSPLASFASEEPATAKGTCVPKTLSQKTEYGE